MINLLNAEIKSTESTIIGELVYSTGFSRPMLSMVMAEPDDQGHTMALVLNTESDLPYVTYYDRGDEVLSFGTDWCLKPNFHLDDVSDTARWRRSHLVIARGGFYFHAKGDQSYYAPLLVPVNGIKPDAPTKLRMTPVPCRGYKIYHSTTAFENGELPIHQVDQSDLVSG